MLDNLSRNKKILLLALTGVFVIATVLSVALRKPESVDTLPEDVGNFSVGTQAYIQEGDELVRALKSVDAYNSFSEDLYLFAKTAYGEYKNSPDKPVGFEVVSDITSKDGAVSFDGKYGSVENTIKVEIKLLNNSKITTSITDHKTKLNIDSQLPSNTKNNQFLGKLPYTTPTYKIVYNSSVNSFTITALTPDSNIRQIAIDYIRANSGLTPNQIKTVYIPYLD